MQILVNTDNHIAGSTELTSLIEAEVERAVGRFGKRMTRVQVHVTDQNSNTKSSDRDKRCLMEARVAGHEPIVIRQDGSTIQQAIEGAANKLEETLDRTLGRQDDRKGGTPYGGNLP